MNNNINKNISNTPRLVSIDGVQLVEEILNNIKRTFPDIPMYTPSQSINDIMYQEGGRKVLQLIERNIKQYK